MEQQAPEVNAVSEKNARQGVKDSSSSPASIKYAAKISLEDKSGNVMDKLVKNPTDLVADCKTASGG